MISQHHLVAWSEVAERARIVAICDPDIGRAEGRAAASRRPALVRQPFMAHEKRLFISEDLIHQLDVARWLLGPLKAISARSAHTLPDVAGETMATVLLETITRAPVVVSGALVAPGFGPRSDDRLELIGTRGSALLSDGMLRCLGEATKSFAFDKSTAYQESFNATIEHFIRCLEDGRPFESSATDNLETLRLVDAAYSACDASLGVEAAASERE
jgi:predicted dehydrogenase